MVLELAIGQPLRVGKFKANRNAALAADVGDLHVRP